MDLELKSGDRHRYYEEQSIKDDQEEDEEEEEAAQPEPLQNFVIAISGCSSAGKTTLALLLTAVLRRALRGMAVADDRDGDEPPLQLPLRTAAVHQDAYFLENPNPSSSPMVAIHPLWPEDRLAARMAGPDDDDPPLLVEDRDRVGACDVGLLAAHIDERDAGARRAVPNPRFLEALYEGREDGEGSFAALDAALSELPPGTLEVAVDVLRGALCRDGEALARARRYVRVDGRSSNNDGAPLVARRFTVVEGFTVLARDAERDPIGWVAPGSEARGLRALRRVQDRLDVSLFLPVERGEARRRRFSRARYRDVPGGARRPGEYWKCGAYFDQVVWPHYERYHRHILPHLAAAYADDDRRRQQEQHGRPWCVANAWERDPRVCGVHVRPAAVSSVGDTLLWASSVVGAVLGERLLLDSELESAALNMDR
ncbi:hypothetical protein F5Y05DRAFT_409563 [Hypoxylon sp. FL0543]|nr:hypothetical protein F5Y05DRAFT_409563 [Hypoxylon sp. FL0543]